jgi:hypothetical protein
VLPDAPGVVELVPICPEEPEALGAPAVPACGADDPDRSVPPAGRFTAMITVFPSGAWAWAT